MPHKVLPKLNITKINVSIQKFLLLIKIFALDVIVVFRVLTYLD